jgi:hypothetical protein
LSIRKYQIEVALNRIADKIRPLYKNNHGRLIWDNIYALSILLLGIATPIIIGGVYSYNNMYPNRGYDIVTPGSIFFENPWSNILWILCILWAIMIAVGAIFSIGLPIKRRFTKFIERQKEDIAYFEEYNNIKPRNEESLFEEDDKEEPGLFDDIHDYDNIKEKAKRS